MTKERFNTLQAIVDTVRKEGTIDYSEAISLMREAQWPVFKRKQTIDLLLGYNQIRNIPEAILGGA